MGGREKRGHKALRLILSLRESPPRTKIISLRGKERSMGGIKRAAYRYAKRGPIFKRAID